MIRELNTLCLMCCYEKRTRFVGASQHVDSVLGFFYPCAFRNAFLFCLATTLPRLLLRSQPGESATLVAKKVLRTFFI